MGIPENKAKHHRQGHVLSQALGHDGPVRPEVDSFDLASDDTILLCSDGVSEFVTEATMSKLLVGRGIDRGSKRLVDAALEAGTSDNCTAAAIRIP
jgi:protein phosphatase